MINIYIVTLHLEQLNIVPDLMKTMDKKLNKKKNIFQDDSEEERLTIFRLTSNTTDRTQINDSGKVM